MNKDRRKEISLIMANAEEVKLEIENLAEEEQDYFDTMPEGIQSSEKGDSATQAVDFLEQAAYSLEELISSLEEAMA